MVRARVTPPSQSSAPSRMHTPTNDRDPPCVSNDKPQPIRLPTAKPNDFLNELTTHKRFHQRQAPDAPRTNLNVDSPSTFQPSDDPPLAIEAADAFPATDSVINIYFDDPRLITATTHVADTATTASPTSKSHSFNGSIAPYPVLKPPRANLHGTSICKTRGALSNISLNESTARLVHDHMNKSHTDA